MAAGTLPRHGAAVVRVLRCSSGASSTASFRQALNESQRREQRCQSLSSSGALGGRLAALCSSTFAGHRRRPGDRDRDVLPGAGRRASSPRTWGRWSRSSTTAPSIVATRRLYRQLRRDARSRPTPRPRPASRRRSCIMSRQLPAPTWSSRARSSRFDDLITGRRHDQRGIHGAVLAGAARQRHRRQRALRRAVPEFDAAALLQQGRSSRRRASIPEKPPQNWAELVDAAKKLTKRDGDRVTRCGIMMPSNYDYCGWILEALTMSNGGRYFNEEYGGEVYYDAPTHAGRRHLLVATSCTSTKCMPPGEPKGPGVSTAFLAGQSAMMILSTGSLTFVRNNTKFPFGVAFVPMNVRNAVPIGGGSLVHVRSVIDDGQAQSRLDVDQVAHRAGDNPAGGAAPPATSRRNKAAYDLPEMKEFLAKNPDAKIALEQLDLRQAVVCDLQDARRAQGDRGRDAGRAVRQGTAERSGGEGAKERGRNHAAFRRADRAQTSGDELTFDATTERGDLDGSPRSRLTACPCSSRN